jgi:cytochrome c oxidase cbb3-type subunit 4
MLRFITHNLSTIQGVSLYPMLSLLIFVIFFALVLIRVLRMKKNRVSELSNIPLEDANEDEFKVTRL